MCRQTWGNVELANLPVRVTEHVCVISALSEMSVERSLASKRQRLDRLTTPELPPPPTRPRLFPVERGSDRRAADVTSAQWPERLQQTHTVAYLSLQHTHARA